MSEASPGPRALLYEVLLATIGATAVVALLSLVQEQIPLLRANLYLVVAAIFLYLPVVLLRRRGLSTLDVGLTTRPRLRGLCFALGAMFLVFPPFAGGFHLWQRWMFDGQPHFSGESYHRWPALWEGRPGKAADSDGLSLYLEGNELRLRWKGLGRELFQLRVVTDGQLRLLASAGASPALSTPDTLLVKTRAPGELRLRVRGGAELTVYPQLGTALLPAQQIRLGAGSVAAEETPLRGHRSYDWLWLLILSHLLLVALPEELFYRGYAQTTLDQVWPRRWRVLGVEVGVSILVVSVLFALGHFLVDFRVQRLAVFFPSLLFGYLRAGSGSLLAPILFHAASNICSDLLNKGYMP